MPIEHPNAKSTYVVHEGRFFARPGRTVLVIETDLPTNPQHPAFDAKAIEAMVAAGQAYVVAQNRKVDDYRIVPLGDRI
jgi:hypothetical protein